MNNRPDQTQIEDLALASMSAPPEPTKPKGFHWRNMLAGVLASIHLAKAKVGKILNPMPRAPHLETIEDIFRPRPEFHMQPKRRRGVSAKSPHANRKQRRVRLARATGPGSINARADALALASKGKWTEAADLLDHVANNPSAGDKAIAATWRRYATEGLSYS